MSLTTTLPFSVHQPLQGVFCMFRSAHQELSKRMLSCPGFILIVKIEVKSSCIQKKPAQCLCIFASFLSFYKFQAAFRLLCELFPEDFDLRQSDSQANLPLKSIYQYYSNILSDFIPLKNVLMIGVTYFLKTNVLRFSVSIVRCEQIRLCFLLTNLSSKWKV